METEILCGLGRLQGTPVFVLPLNSPELKRVFGAMFFPQEGVWRFPAFYPYCGDVARDLEIVLPNIKFSDLAAQHIVTCHQLAAEPLTFVPPQGFEFLTKPYDHQLEGLAFVLRNSRCGLFYDMGLGKTKVMADAIRVLKKKTLVLSPTVGIGTWLAEIARHGHDLKAVALTGKSEAGKAAVKALNAQKKAIKDALKKATDPTETFRLEGQLAELPGPGVAAKYADIEAAAEADVVIVSYDTAKLYQKEILEKLPYEMIIADESHGLRSPTSDRTKAAIALSSKAGQRVILSGTPSLGNPLHTWGQLAFLGKYLPAKDLWTFYRHYLIRAKGERKIVLGFKNLDVLRDKVARICTRKTKEECLDLPERTIMDVPFTLFPEQKSLYNDIAAGIVVELDKGELYEPGRAATSLIKLLQITSGFMIKPAPPVCDECEKLLICAPAKIKPFTPICPKYPNPNPQEIHRLKTNAKLDALEELLDGVLAEERNQVIIWAMFREELNLVEALLQQKGWGYFRVDGSNSNKAQALSTQFNQDPTKRVWLAQISTGVALTLTGASYMVYFGLTWQLGDYLQSLDRNYRIGQTSKVFVYRLLCQNSVLDYMVRVLDQKRNIASSLVDRIDCLLCVHSRERNCVENDTKPFEGNCIHQSRVKRLVTRPKTL